MLGSLENVFADKWHHLRYASIRYSAVTKDTAYASIIVKKLDSRMQEFQLKLGVYPDQSLQLKIIPTRAMYKQITKGKGKLVTYSEAFYSPVEQLIYVRSPDQIPPGTYDQVLLHEYIHWFLDNTIHHTPLWFHEGMAVYYSGQFGFQSYVSFSRYRFMRIRLSLQEMDYAYPRDKSHWDMFYLTSAFAINYLDSKYPKQYQSFWNNVGYAYSRPDNPAKAKPEFNQLFFYSFNMSVYAFGKIFDHAMARYSWMFPLIGINAVIFAILPFIVYLAWLKNRRKMKLLPDLPEEKDCEIADQDEAALDDHNPENCD